MTLSVNEKKSLSQYRLEKAVKLLKDAQLLLEQQRYESSVNRSYYAALTAAKGALILLGVDPRTHEGVKTMVGKKIILGGYAQNEYGKLLRNLLSEREDADYADFVEVDKNDAESAYKNASAFIEKSGQVIDQIKSEMNDSSAEEL